MPQFQYRGLGERRQPIRLVTIFPGCDRQPVSLQLHHTIMTQETPPIYEALSYVWGSSDDGVAVSVAYSDDTYQSTLTVGQNLFIALQHLRRADKPRTMWIDAVCINQQDIAERSSQVRNMGNVYRLASRVVVWLGEAENDSDFIMSLVQDVGARMQREPDGWIQYLESQAYKSRAMHALHFLLLRLWFKRVWIRQEIGLANGDSVVMCGHIVMPWQHFREVLRQLRTQPYFELLGETVVVLEETRRAILPMSGKPSSRLFSRLYQARPSQCLDPKDRIYANLNLTASIYRDKIKVDYSMSTLDLYRQVVLVDLEMGDLSMLGHCDISTRPSGWPSWVPDWTNPFCTRVLAKAKSSSILLPDAEYVGDDILQATGLIISRIKSLDRTRFHRDRSNFNTELRRLANKRIEGSYVNGKSLLEAFCDTICCGDFNTPELDSDFPVLETTMPYVEALVGNAENQFNKPPTALEYHIPRHCHGRSLLWTDHGYLGLCPAGSQPGDVIAVLLGCDVPLALRLNESWAYEVVGQCYVSGFMDGEVILGGLPHYSRKDSRVAAFRSRMEGLHGVSYQALDNDCRNQAEESQEHMAISDIGSDCDRGDGDDSWLRSVTPEMLHEAGIDVKAFKLV
ncbi:HET domain-containing protein [Fusarium sp. LHS14.1]|nr:HET domain-containing protein [Fusarium sp. LHS14.1]